MTMQELGMQGYLVNQLGGNQYATQDEIMRQQREAYLRQMSALQNANPFGSTQQQMAQPQPTKPTDDPLLVLLTEE